MTCSALAEEGMEEMAARTAAEEAAVVETPKPIKRDL